MVVCMSQTKWGHGSGGGFSHIRAEWVCARQKPTIFWPGPLLKTPCFWPEPQNDTRLTPHPHFKQYQYMFLCECFLPWPIQKTPILKNITNSHVFFIEEPLPNAPIFNPLAAGIYHFHIRLPTKGGAMAPRLVTQGKQINHRATATPDDVVRSECPKYSHH